MSKTIVKVTAEALMIQTFRVAQEMGRDQQLVQLGCDPNTPLRIYGVPRGGVPATLALIPYIVPHFGAAILVDHVDDAHVIVDDIISSGATRKRFAESHPHLPFYALYNGAFGAAPWYVFPWEETLEGSAGDIVTRLLEFIGEDTRRPGLRDTPERVLRAWQEWTVGYGQDPNEVLKSFEDGAQGVDEMVVVRDIPFWSMCEHHLAPFFGVAHVGYIPSGRVLGLSKFVRLVNIYARRLQVQERLTSQIADALFEGLKPKGVGIVISARHTCMESRGVNTYGAHTVTSCLLGAMREGSARAEFLRLAQKEA